MLALKVFILVDILQKSLDGSSWNLWIIMSPYMGPYSTGEYGYFGILMGLKNTLESFKIP